MRPKLSERATAARGRPGGRSARGRWGRGERARVRGRGGAAQPGLEAELGLPRAPPARVRAPPRAPRFQRRSQACPSDARSSRRTLLPQRPQEPRVRGPSGGVASDKGGSGLSRPTGSARGPAGDLGPLAVPPASPSAPVAERAPRALGRCPPCRPASRRAPARPSFEESRGRPRASERPGRAAQRAVATGARPAPRTALRPEPGRGWGWLSGALPRCCQSKKQNKVLPGSECVARRGLPQALGAATFLCELTACVR